MAFVGYSRQALNWRWDSVQVAWLNGVLCKENSFRIADTDLGTLTEVSCSG
jgi:hypothetical protein